MFKTVKNKFIILSIIFIVTTATIPIVFLILQFRANFNQRSLLLIESTIDILSTGLNTSMIGGEHRSIQNMIEQLSLNKSVEHIRIIDTAGVVICATDVVEIGKSLDIVSPHHIDFRRDDLNTRKVHRLTNKDIYRVTEPIHNQQACQNCHLGKPILGYIDVDTDLTKAEMNFYTGSKHFIFLAIAIVLIMFIGSYFLFNHYINKPLKLFFAAIDNVEKGNLSTRLPDDKDDEFGVLQGHFNKMVERLNESQEKIEELHFEQLQRADKLVTLGELTSEMAHEINNHAGIIMSRADYLKLESENDPGIKSYSDDLDVILNQIRNISTITGNILRHGKKTQKNFKSLNLAKVVDESLRILEPLFQKRNINYVKDFQGTYFLITGDLLLIEQLLTNLAINALDAIEGEGEIKVTLKKDSNNMPQLIFSDSGKGIARKEISQIFSPFYTTKPSGKGTGLGLYIVKNICKSHDATIECDSILDKGTTFRITFKGEAA